MTGENDDEEAAARVSWGVQGSALHRAAAAMAAAAATPGCSGLRSEYLQNHASHAAFFRPTVLFLYHFAIFIEFADLTRC